MYTDYVDGICIYVSCKSRARVGDMCTTEVCVVLYVLTVHDHIDKGELCMCPVAQMAKACDCYTLADHKIESSSLSGAVSFFSVHETCPNVLVSTGRQRGE